MSDTGSYEIFLFNDKFLAYYFNLANGFVKSPNGKIINGLCYISNFVTLVSCVSIRAHWLLVGHTTPH